MEITIGFGVLLAIVIGMVEIVKRLGVNEKFLPIAAIIFGLGFSTLTYFVSDIELLNAIINGIIIGLSAVGLWSSGKNVAEGFRGQIS